MANPFADDDDYAGAGLYSNPFADAAVTQALNDTADQDYSSYSYAPSMATQPPPPPVDDKPWKHQSSAGGPSEAEIMAIARQKQEMMQREEELERQRQALAAAQSQAPSKYDYPDQQQQIPTGGSKVKNWPFFYPILYHSIKDEIPKEDQKTVLTLYYSWMLNIACYVVNMAGCMCILIAGYSGKDFGYSIMYIVLNTPLSFFLYYKPVYNAYSRDSSFYFSIFFFFGGWHVAWMVYILLGIQDSGCAGFINTIFMFGYSEGTHKGEAIVLLVGLLMWAANLATFVYLYLKVRLHYRSKGHTLQEARNQAFSSAASNPTVQQAAVGAASSYVSSQYQRQVDEV